MKNTTTVTDFKDLRKAIEEIQKNQPAETRYQQQAKKMGYTKDKSIVVEQTLVEKNLMPEIQKIVDTKGAAKVGGVMLDMFTASVLTKAYDKVNDANKKKMETSNITTLVKLAQKVMGLKASNEFGKDPLKGFPYNETNEAVMSEGAMSDMLIDIQQGATAKELARDYKMPLSTAKDFLKSYYGQKKGSRKESVSEERVGIKEKNINEEVLIFPAALITVIGQNKLEKLMKKHDAYWTDGTPTGSVKGDKLARISSPKPMKAIKKDINMILRPTVLKMKEENIQEGESLLDGTWAIPDSRAKLNRLNQEFLKTKKLANSPAQVKKYARGIDPLFGDDSFSDDMYLLELLLKNEEEARSKYGKGPGRNVYAFATFKGRKIEMNKGMDMRDILVTHLDEWMTIKNYKIISVPAEWLDEGVTPGLQKKKPGNFKKPRGKFVKFEDRLDPVGKADDDIDNDGDVDSSDKYLHKRRKAIGKAMQKEDKTELEKKPQSELTPSEKDELRRKKMRDAERAKNVANMKRSQDKANSPAEKERRRKERERNLSSLKGKETFRDRQKRLGKSQTEQLQSDFENAKRSPFKLKSQAYPKAVGIVTEGFGIRHATNQDLLEACDSFGMITEQELQLEQLEKTLGRSGFLTYNKVELDEIFEDRETQRIILALESVTEDKLEPINYSWQDIDTALEEELDVEFVKPDGMKAIGPVLKMCENTYNLKDKHTGKSFTFKYAGENMKSFNQIISEAKFPKKLVRQAGGIAFDKRYVGGNMTGAVKAIEKLKKGLSDDPKVRDMLRLANESFNNEFYNALSEDEKTAYQKFFTSALKKYGVSSPAELEGDKEKEFYNYVDKNWSGKGEKKESVEEGKYTEYSDLLLMKARIIAKEGPKSDKLPAVNSQIKVVMKRLGVKEGEENPSKMKVDGRRTNFREKMRKLGYIKNSI